MMVQNGKRWQWGGGDVSRRNKIQLVGADRSSNQLSRNKTTGRCGESKRLLVGVARTIWLIEGE